MINNHHEKHDLPIFSDLKAGTIENLSNDPDIITGFNKIFGRNIAMQNLFLILTDQEHKKKIRFIHVYGISGSGKTALVNEVAKYCR